MRFAFCSHLGRRGVDRDQAPSRTAFSMRSSHSDQAVRTTARNSSLTASPSHRLMNVTPDRDGPRSRKRISMNAFGYELAAVGSGSPARKVGTMRRSFSSARNSPVCCLTDAYQRVRTPIASRPYSACKRFASRYHAAPSPWHDDGLQTSRHRAAKSRRGLADPRAETQAERREQQRHKCGHAKHSRACTRCAPGPRGDNRRRCHA